MLHTLQLSDVDFAYNVFTFFIVIVFSHRNVAVRKTTAQFLSLLAERMGASRLMSGAKDVTEKILPTAAQFVTDGGPENRYTCEKNRDSCKNCQYFTLCSYLFL